MIKGMAAGNLLMSSDILLSGAKQEIPTPEMARRFPHLSDITNKIPQLNENAKIHLLIG